MAWSALMWPGGVRTTVDFWSATSFWACVFLAIWLCVNLALTAIGVEQKMWGGVRKGTVSLKVAMLCHHVLVSALAVVAILEDSVLMRVLFTQPGNAAAAADMLRDERLGPSQAAEALTPVTTGYMVADLILISQWDLSGQAGVMEAALMVMHHVLSLMSWPCAVIWNFCSRYVVILLSYELSSIFLSGMWLLSNSGRKSSSLYMICGLLFTLSFVIVRMLGALPQLAAFWQAPPWMAYLDGVPSWAPPWSAFLVIPHLLNLMWGVKVVQGFMKVVTGKSDKSKGESIEPIGSSSESSGGDSGSDSKVPANRTRLLQE
eukprot:TRINITY_DN50925_c0_g1_i1.p1 TRINITY_DN50925_c0_g1~~TRINITY_DN50925_c0_g1_i1.p1  ORF type:complete len:334 (-),score=69.61 TRINITY_DN50925_c0_g1_i1:25-978(-)